MLKLQKLFLIPLLLISIIVNAQTRTVRGKVVSSQNNQPISGAAVQVKDKSIGTITNNDGSFSLNVPGGTVTLVISNIGYTSVERTVEANLSEINITLVESSSELNTVVVTALGVTKNKRNLNYSTQTVETQDLAKARETNVANSLSGKVAGLDVVRSSQGVGSNVRVVLRGDRSFVGSSEALIIIDGIPGDLGSLNPDDIASMNVLKGSSASALYGSNAQNGAIIITTKKGAAGKGLA